MSRIGMKAFEITEYDSLWYRGIVVSETEKTLSVSTEPEKHRPFRLNRGKLFLVSEGTDLKAVEAGFRAARAPMDAEVARLQAELTELRKQRSAAGRAYLLSIGESA